MRSPGRTNTGSEAMLADDGCVGEVCTSSLSALHARRSAANLEFGWMPGGGAIRALSIRPGSMQTPSCAARIFLEEEKPTPLLRTSYNHQHFYENSLLAEHSRSSVSPPAEALSKASEPRSIAHLLAQTLHRMSESRGVKPGPEPADRVAIGITFGNSNSSIAFTVDDKAEVIANEDGGECFVRIPVRFARWRVLTAADRPTDPDRPVLCRRRRVLRHPGEGFPGAQPGQHGRLLPRLLGKGVRTPLEAQIRPGILTSFAGSSRLTLPTATPPRTPRTPLAPSPSP